MSCMFELSAARYKSVLTQNIHFNAYGFVSCAKLFVLSNFLFRNLWAYLLQGEKISNVEIKIIETLIDNLRYADDTILIAKNLQELQSCQ